VRTADFLRGTALLYVTTSFVGVAYRIAARLSTSLIRDNSRRSRSRKLRAVHCSGMKARSTNRFLLWALAISAALHFAAAGIMRTIPSVAAAPEQPAMHIVVAHLTTPAPPPPTPTPAPQPIRRVRPARASRAVAKVAVAVPKTHPPAAIGAEPPHVAPSGNGVAQNLAQGEPTAPPTPPKPSCSQPFAAARTIEAVMPSTPDDAAGVTGTAEVQVTLDAAGRVTDARIYRSTDDLRLDRAAVIAARTSRYAPAIADCTPTGGTYLFRVDFQD
jgi:periplasmic protein TonB